MFRIPVRGRTIHQNIRLKSTSSSSFIRNTFVDYFVDKHGHKHVKSSPVVPLCDSTVPFVNAGMNQFKGVFLGRVDAPWPRVVNSQKCVRVGGKHNDLDVVGMDGHHHTFFEMLGNWSFGDYYKKEACQMAWDLLLGPYRLKPENLVVTYFAGDVVLNITEDRECRDAWRAIGVPDSRLKALDAKENFWEMGATGPCGPCTEIHYVNPDGSLTEIWNLVFIQCNREADGKVSNLRRQHVDTGMGLERMAAVLQGVPSNYDTDLFRPLIQSIEKNSKSVSPYGGKYGSQATLDSMYRRLADHARMISVCLADGVFPASSLNLKQIMRKSFKISTDVFQNPKLLPILYQQVIETLGPTYPELISKEKDAKLIMEHEEQAYRKMRTDLVKKWKDLVKRYPEAEGMADVEIAGFALGYKEFKETMSKLKSTVIPGELVFKLYDTHGFQEDMIERIAKLNNMGIDKKGFWKLLSEHKSRHKTAFKEQASNNGLRFDLIVEKLLKSGVKPTNDQHKYNYVPVDNNIEFKPLRTKLVAILNEDCVWIDFLDPCEDRSYYLVAEDSNFYCEEGGQIEDSGIIKFDNNVTFKVASVFKIRDFVFHKGTFIRDQERDRNYVNFNSDVTLEINIDKRLNVMRNHTGVHLLNAAIKKVLPNSVVCPIGSSVTDKGLNLNLSVYGEKLSQKVILDAQELIRESIQTNAAIDTLVTDSIQLSKHSDVVTVPGETYPELGLRLVQASPPLVSKELCCGTHVPSTGFLQEFCVTLVKGAGGHTPSIHALTGERAREVRELYCRAQKLEEVIELVEPDRRKQEVSDIRRQVAALCGGGGAAFAEHAMCLELLDTLMKKPPNTAEVALQSIAEAEIREASDAALSEGRRFIVHFLRCSYLMQEESLAKVLGGSTACRPRLLLGCAGGSVIAACRLPQNMVTETFTAERWLRCILPVFQADVAPAPPGHSPDTYAMMTGTKVSLINCEQLVQDAMRVAIKYAQKHARDSPQQHAPTKNRQLN